MAAQAGLDDLLKLTKIVPVIVVDRVEDAVPLAEALVAGGLPILEVTLRTPAALDAMAAMTKVAGAIVGAGTVHTGEQLKRVEGLGARFAVSPGATERLLEAADASSVPLLPGVATVSEGMALVERGYRFAKFFPAEAAGGANYLKSIGSPLPQLKFCPTGGVTPGNLKSYLSLPNVVCAGGSWMCAAADVNAGKFDAIRRAAAEAVAAANS